MAAPRRIPREPFPFTAHRTLAGVARTEALFARLNDGTLIVIEAHELALLLKARRANNPPRDDDGGRAA